MPGSTFRPVPLFCLLLVATAVPLSGGGAAILWTAPLMLLAAMMIAWGAESAQFFVGQGFALAILAWLQTLPEFAVEAVLAWHQRTELLLSNLAGALQILTGLGWPMIYAAAAHKNRQQGRGGLNRISLDDDNAVQVVALLISLLYGFIIWAKGSLNLFDGAVLVAIYSGYLAVLSRMPKEDREAIGDLPAVPRMVATARKPLRVAGIMSLFGIGGALIYFLAEPFLASVLGLSKVLGLAPFVAIKWIAPLVSEFPEKVSAFKWARKPPEGASMALMNMVSSNINQWTLLPAMLPIVLSLSRRSFSGLVFDEQQSLELLMTLGQALLGCVFLFSMELVWWEALGLFVLWAVQFGFSIAPGGVPARVHWTVTSIYLGWCAVEVGRIVVGWRSPETFAGFGRSLRQMRLRR